MTPLPPVRIPHPHVTLNGEGSPYVGALAVRRLFVFHKQGTTFATLQRRYPGLSIAELLDALAFAYDNTELIEADIAREREAMSASDPPTAPIDPRFLGGGRHE